MASIVKRNKHYSVVYNYVNEDGIRKQKWETYKTFQEAKERKKEVEYKQEIGSLIIPECKTMKELLNEYVLSYGKNQWALSTYQGNVSLIDHYIKPMLGDMKLSDINTRVIEKYYMQLLRTPAVPTPVYGRITERQKTENWTAETLFYALDVCENQRLKLALNVTFACSLRMGELLGLTWDCVEISPHQIRKGNACIYVDKELQRINKEVLKILDNKDVIRTFPVQTAKARTILVLKKPKTESSIRKVFLPKSVALMLVDWKKKQDENKAFLGEEYSDYNLVFAGQLGNPTTQGTIRRELKELITKHDLPPVVFHSFRHASITYKLKLTGDIKDVQGVSGHAQAKMVTDLYSHVLDDSRGHNAELFEEAFYKKTNLDVELDTGGAEDEDNNSADPFIASDQDVEESSVKTPNRRGRSKKSAKETQSENGDFDAPSISDEVVQQLLEDPEILKKILAKALCGLI